MWLFVWSVSVANRGMIHIVGIAGSGMCAAAEVSVACGYHVTGSDRYLDQNIAIRSLSRLQQSGCELYPQDGSGIRPETDAVIVSTAIESDNPDCLRANERSIPIFHRAAWLAKLIDNRPLLGVAGTSGKSTVTAMAGWILASCGRSPFVVNGAAVRGWERADASGQVRSGDPNLWLLELDESDRSLLHFAPLHAVITNISADHFTLDETKSLFSAFRSKVTGSCVDGPWEISDYSNSLNGISFQYKGIGFTLPVLGKHNAENAAAAASLCACIGISFQDCARALSSFPGVHRRLEKYASSGNIYVFDDFAHNPAKIAAAMDSVLALVDNVTVVWRPHGYGPLRNMMDDLVNAFKRLKTESKSGRRRHRVVLLPVYDMGGTAQRDVTSGDLAEALLAVGLDVFTASSYDEVIALCRTQYLQNRDAVLIMGARDPNLPELAKKIAALHENS